MSESATERWLSIVGYEGSYEVSDFGRVRSLQRTIIRSNGAPQTINQCLLRPAPNPAGYLGVALTIGGHLQTRSIHSLVAEAFLGPRPPGKEVRHLDGDCRHNKLGNLRYGTSGENKLDIVAHGRHHWALKTHCPAGHSYDGANTLMYQGRRYCKACRRLRYRARRAENLTGGKTVEGFDTAALTADLHAVTTV